MFGLEDMWADKFSTLKTAIEKVIKAYDNKTMEFVDAINELSSALVEADKIEAW